MKRCFVFFLTSLFATCLAAQTASPVLTITQTNKAATKLSGDEISAMPHTSLQIAAHDGKTHTYEGVFLYALLQKADVRLGDSAKKKTAASYIVITAADNYKTVYAMGEIDTLMSAKKIILADKADGQPLPQNALPYQVIATDEKIHARMIRQVVSIEVHTAE